MLLAVIFILSGFVIRLMHYQIVDSATYKQQSEKTSLSLQAVTAARGEIVDRYGRKLATNKVGFSIIFEYAFFPTDKNDAKRNAKQNPLILNLTKILKEDNETWNDTIPITAVKPYSFTGSDKDVKKFKQKIGLKATDKMTADSAIALLKSRYGLNGFSETDARTVAGVRYGMDQYQFSLFNNSYEFATDVGMNTITKLSERSGDFAGVEVNEVPIRVYPDGTVAPHVLGMVGPIYSDDLQSYKKKNYNNDDIVGHSGIEQAMEQYLRGIDGQKKITLNSKGKITSFETVQEPKPGDTVVLTIDSKLQKLVQNSLKQTIDNIRTHGAGSYREGGDANAGSAVVLNVKTGEVLAMATYPSYDLNSYSKNYSTLIKDPTKPLLNRATKGLYEPGSTFKPCTAAAGLAYGKITKDSVIVCNHVYTRLASEGYEPKCLSTHGARTVETALQVSCNIFFYETGWRLGIANLDKMAANLGLGQPTGIELSENSGTMSSPEEREKKGSSWHDGDILQASIGQLDDSFTPLQLANYVATLVNYGKRNQVHIVKSVKTYDYSQTVLDNKPTVIADAKISAQAVDVVKEGMRKVTEEVGGTAVSVFQSLPFDIGGKTGTPQVPSGSAHGIFISFAPYEDPEIAVAVVVEHGYHGGYTAPIARDVYQYYFLSPDNVAGTTKDNTLLK